MIKKNKGLLIGVCLSVLIVSCSQSESEKVPENKKSVQEPLKPINEEITNKNKVEMLKRLKENIAKETPIGVRTITLNGEKYLFEGEKLQKGTQVRNIHMSEFGTIKGTFVVVLMEGVTPDLSFKHKEKIAKDTFRLTPAKADDLMTIYKELLVNKSIVTVEMEVSYSGEKSGTATY